MWLRILGAGGAIVLLGYLLFAISPQDSTADGSAPVVAGRSAGTVDESDMIPVPPPVEIVVDAATPADEEFAAEQLRQHSSFELAPVRSDSVWVRSRAKELGVAQSAVVHGLGLLKLTNVRDFHAAVTDWLGDSYAGGWIDWESDTPFFYYAYADTLPEAPPPPLLTVLLDLGDLALVPVAESG
jgi:hypothetical protein